MMNNIKKLSTYEWLISTRPKWWIFNPWLYIKRRDIAYAEALQIIEDLSKGNQ